MSSIKSHQSALYVIPNLLTPHISTKLEKLSDESRTLPQSEKSKKMVEIRPNTTNLAYARRTRSSLILTRHCHANGNSEAM